MGRVEGVKFPFQGALSPKLPILKENISSLEGHRLRPNRAEQDAGVQAHRTLLGDVHGVSCILGLVLTERRKLYGSQRS